MLQAAIGESQVGIPAPSPGQRVASKIAKVKRCRGPQLRAVLKAMVYTAFSEESRARVAGRARGVRAWRAQQRGVRHCAAPPRRPASSPRRHPSTSPLVR